MDAGVKVVEENVLYATMGSVKENELKQITYIMLKTVCQEYYYVSDVRGAPAFREIIKT